MLLFFQQGTLSTGLDLGQIITDLLPALNAYSTSDLVDWTETELYQWGDEAAQRLSRICGVLVERTDMPVSAGAGTVTLPDRHLSTIHSTFGTRSLRPSSAQELEALDSGWLTATGGVERISHDYDGLKTARLYRIPDAAGMLHLIYHTRPESLTSGNLTLDAPTPIGEYLTFSILAEARRREGDGAMPEVADAAQQRADMLAKVIESYWGGAQ